MNVRHNLVLLLKAVKDEVTADSYLQILGDIGCEAYCVPVLGFTFFNLECLYTALSKSDDYCCLLLSSVRAVEAISMAIHNYSSINEWKDGCLREKWNKKNIFVVGPATAAAAAQELSLETYGSQSGNSANLAKKVVEVLRNNKAEYDGQPALFPCGNLKQETLPGTLQAEGIPVHCVTVYKTSPDANVTDNLEKFMNLQGYPEFIVFYSPSGVNFTHQLLQQRGFLQDNVHLIAIGPTTKEAILEKGLKVSGTALNPTAIDLCKVIKELQGAVH